MKPSSTSAMNLVRGQVESSRTDTSVASRLIHTTERAKIVVLYTLIDIYGIKAGFKIRAQFFQL